MTGRDTAARGFPAGPQDGPAPADGDPYLTFHSAVVLSQLTQWLGWLPAGGRVLDLSLPLPDAWSRSDFRISAAVAAAGHQVITVAQDSADLQDQGRTHTPVVVADPRSLDWVRSESVDAVIAENGALSYSLATEDTMQGIARVLRPGGRFLASAESMVIGLSRLAEQHRWPELADAPAADVMLVPDPAHAGGYTRCFSPEDLRELLADAGLAVEWVRPRTVLPAAGVRQALAADPAALADLVSNELNLAGAHEGEAHGAHHLISGILS